MNNILNRYFLTFLHPFAQQEEFYKKRLLFKEEQRLKSFELVKQNEDQSVSETSGLGLIETLSVSWIFHLIQTFYALLALLLGLQSAQLFMGNEEFSFISLRQNETAIFFLLLKVTLFPLIFWFYVKFWVNIIKLCSHIFEIDEDIEEISQQIVNGAFTTHAFLTIPLFGGIVQHFARLLYLFAGLRRNLRLNVWQSLFILMVPVIAGLLLALLFGLSIMVLITGL
jgi:hypothetical protein